MQWQNFFSPTSSEYASFFNINSKTIERTKTVEQIDITKHTQFNRTKICRPQVKGCLGSGNGFDSSINSN